MLEHWASIVGAVLLAGPLVCGTSQAANDWFDRHVDAINEPGRPIPSGRIPGRWGLYIAIGWTLLSLAVGAALGRWVLAATVIGLALAWAYSAPPFRLKRNGWWGNAAVGLCYEGLPWFTGAAALTSVLPDGRITLFAVLYSAGAFGIMVLNDFKAIEGDRELGIRTLPVQLGVRPAALLACGVMAAPQMAVIGILFAQGRAVEAWIVAGLLAAQGALMPALVRAPRKRAPLYNATGTTFYVLGMLASAFALRELVSAV
jgi:chlorophyll synthase